uniref:NADH dehydrogenase subunit 2 n=1 Tax=Sulcionema specki TaxID=2016126 RepID=A0A6G5ZU29_9EUGL|nr:NADH dehydrogenase subunit 2 [Sulcionema specki]
MTYIILMGGMCVMICLYDNKVWAVISITVLTVSMIHDGVLSVLSTWLVLSVLSYTVVLCMPHKLTGTPDPLLTMWVWLSILSDILVTVSMLSQDTWHTYSIVIMVMIKLYLNPMSYIWLVVYNSMHIQDTLVLMIISYVLCYSTVHILDFFFFFFFFFGVVLTMVLLMIQQLEVRSIHNSIIIVSVSSYVMLVGGVLVTAQQVVGSILVVCLVSVVLLCTWYTVVLQGHSAYQVFMYCYNITIHWYVMILLVVVSGLVVHIYGVSKIEILITSIIMMHVFFFFFSLLIMISWIYRSIITSIILGGGGGNHTSYVDCTSTMLMGTMYILVS